METNACTELTCQGGNCPGCSNGQLWCDDPRCAPYCRGCEPKEDQDKVINMMFGIIVIVLVIIIFILLFFHGPRFVILHDGDQNKTYEADREHGWGLREI